MMTTPPKPWENAGPGFRYATDIPNAPNFSRGPGPLHSPFTSGQPQLIGGAPVRTVRNTSHAAPPPLPPRPSPSGSQFQMGHTVRPIYSPYGSYGSYGGYSGYGGYSPFGGYGSYGAGYGYNRYGGYPSRAEPESRFIQLAEESTRPAFQSIESLVQAFSSVTFMLESTFGAIHNSFRAVLSVAENMGRLRSVFGQFFSVFAIFRTLQWLYKKCLYLLGLTKCDPSQEEIWQQTASEGGEAIKSRVSWPVLILMGLMLSGPYLMWKLLKTLKLNVSSDTAFDFNQWKRSQYPATVAVAQYDFQAANEDELSIRVGQRVIIAPQDLQSQSISSGWVLATVDKRKSGLVPFNYLRVVGRIRSNQQPENVMPTSSVPVTASGNTEIEQLPVEPNLEEIWPSLPSDGVAGTSSSEKQSTEEKIAEKEEC